jgi:hypothetical protein
MGGGHKLDGSGSGQRQVAGCCECGNEPSSFIKLVGGGGSRLAEKLLASQEGLCSMELVSLTCNLV